MPVIKQLALLTKKQGMDHEAFVKRYEEGHAPLIERIARFHDAYQRNFIKPGSLIELAHIPDPPPPPQFHCITQLMYEGQHKLDDLMDKLANSDIGQQIAADEEDLFDRTKMAMFAADEYATPLSQLQPRPEGHVGPPLIKQVALLRKKAGMSREDFIAYYKNNHAPLAMRLLRINGAPCWAGYKRTFPVPAGNAEMGHLGGPQLEVDFDVMSEFWYWNQDHFDQFMEIISQPEIGAEIAHDEEQFFDRSKVTIFLVEQKGDDFGYV